MPILISHCTQQTFELGKQLGLKLKPGNLVCLYGDLGAGKTVLTQGIAAGLGIDLQKIKSPTFVFARDYPLKKGRFYHLDLYRIEGKVSWQGLGLEEILGNPENICVIEWADRIQDDLPKKRIEVKIEGRGEGKRKIVIK